MAKRTPRTFLAIGAQFDADLASVQLAEPTAGITYAFSLLVLPQHWDIAHACGLSRTLIKKLRGRKAFEDRGTEDERIDTEGALAEILMAMLLEKAGAQIAPLVAHKPDSGGVDVVLDGRRLDVKSIGQAKTLVNINCRQHAEKFAEAYVLVRFTRADVADVFVVSHDAVTAMKRVECLRGTPLDPRRYFYSARMPTNFEPLPEETEV